MKTLRFFSCLAGGEWPTMTVETLQFPVFGRYRVTHRLPAVALCALIAALTWSHWRWIGMSALALVLWLAVPMLVIDVVNAFQLRVWVRRFEKRIHPWNLEAYVQSQPARFRLHMRHYQGFGVNAVLPAAVLEDLESGSLCVVSPPSARIDEIAARSGIAVQSH
ncbi:hypothetical protein [Prosthecobacter sp.]|uniref:hypothetical protein n=1 Tax=Prosthecobacter sp. TaxID=1965333 RepID=UPI002AB9AB95|nr:hypothetical protein [Prosthecobacter sp.]MDZ4401657.1 hypothetical protein [Prosthecobacter sp.]